MHSLNDVTGLLADRENVLPALRSAQVELVDCVEIFDGIGVEPARKELKKLFDRGGVHDVWNAGGFQVETGSRGAAAPGIDLRAPCLSTNHEPHHGQRVFSASS